MWVCLSVCEFCSYWDADASKNSKIKCFIPNSNKKNVAIILMIYGWDIGEIWETFGTYLAEKWLNYKTDIKGDSKKTLPTFFLDFLDSYKSKVKASHILW